MNVMFITWFTGVELLGCGYSEPPNDIESDCGAMKARLLTQSSESNHAYYSHGTTEYEAFSFDVCITGITETMRSSTPSFLLITVKHALVPLGHYYIEIKDKRHDEQIMP
jgi:hypothetical protein